MRRDIDEQLLRDAWQNADWATQDAERAIQHATKLPGFAEILGRKGKALAGVADVCRRFVEELRPLLEEAKEDQAP